MNTDLQATEMPPNFFLNPRLFAGSRGKYWLMAIKPVTRRFTSVYPWRFDEK